MEAIVIGGSGEYGAGVAKELAKMAEFERVVITGRDLEKAQRVANDIGSKVKAVQIDITDHDRLIGLLRGTGIVAFTAHPHRLWALPVMKAAIQARVNYIDINEDLEIVESQLALDKDARKAGITMLTGMGAMPGFTNICARRGADQLDRADSIKVVGAVFPGPLRRPGYWITIFDYFTGTVPILRDGKIVEVPAGSEPEVIDFLPPVGPWEVRLRTDAILGSIPRNIKGLREVVVKGSYLLSGLSRLQRLLAQDLNLISKKPLKVGDVSVTPFDFIGEFITSDEFCKTEIMSNILAEQKAKQGKTGGAHWVEVKGQKDGKPARYVYREWQSNLDHTYPTRMAMAVAARMIATGEIAQKGVIFPEQLDSKLMLDRLARANIVIEEKFEEQ